ncbi:anti-sigma factor domain-containing protein [Nocardia brasiliensis]|uniref:anti-sigma factor n=1 Tax=Nocardia brasiliensis TaxID=37326 RepID=UPI00378766A1
MTAESHHRTGAYVLDALAGDARADFERHLLECPPCHVEVDALRPVAVRLATAVAPVSATAVQERVLAEIGMRPQVCGSASALGRTQIIPTAGELERTVILPPLEELSDNDSPADIDRRGWLVRVWIGVAVAAAVVAVGLVLADRTAGPDATVAEQVRNARDAVTHTGVVFAGDGSATAVLSRSVGKVVVSATGLPAPGSGHGYQLWLIHADGTPRSAGMMHTADTTTELTADLLRTTTALGITAEPVTGSATPTSPPVVRIEMH